MFYYSSVGSWATETFIRSRCEILIISCLWNKLKDGAHNFYILSVLAFFETEKTNNSFIRLVLLLALVGLCSSPDWIVWESEWNSQRRSRFLLSPSTEFSLTGIPTISTFLLPPTLLQKCEPVLSWDQWSFEKKIAEKFRSLINGWKRKLFYLNSFSLLFSK